MIFSREGFKLLRTASALALLSIGVAVFLIASSHYYRQADGQARGASPDCRLLA